MMGWLPVLAWAAGAYHLQDVTTTHPDPGITRVEYRILAGKSSLNRFSITHVERRGNCRHDRAPIVLLSPFLLPGSFYEITETNDYSQSAAGKLALDGYDVWLVDQRRTGLAPGSCETGSADCSVMEEWDWDTFSEDGLLALSMAQALSPGKKPIVGGFSAGSTAAVAVANRAPQAIAGLFLYEGTFYTQDPTIIAHNTPICQQLDAAIRDGQYYDPSAQAYGPLLHLAATDPEGTSPLPMFPPGTTNQLAMLYVFSTPAPAGALSPTPGFIRCIADFGTQRFVYTNPERLFQVGPKFDNYAPLAIVRDLSCGLAGLDRSHIDRLSAFHGDVLVYVEGTGFGTAMFDTAALFTHARSVTVNHHPELGESDPYFHTAWQDVFYSPLRQWLSSLAL